MIYFIEVPYRTTRGEGAAIKIGWTETFATFEKRLDVLRTSMPYDPVVLAIVPGDRAHEAALHERHAELRIRGEWYRSSRALRREIDRLHVRADWHVNPDALPCPHCGQPLPNDRRRAIYCSARCRRATANAKRTAKLRASP